MGDAASLCPSSEAMTAKILVIVWLAALQSASCALTAPHALPSLAFSVAPLRSPGSRAARSCVAFASWRAGEEPLSSDVDAVNVVGKTAFCANTYRVLSERKLSKPLYYDAFGHVFLNSWTEQHMQTLEEKSFYPFIYELALRTAWYDGHVKRAIARGIKQIVIIGSGLDCRALRLHDPAVQFFEFDQPRILEYKVSKLSTLNLPRYPSKLIPGDYLELDFKAELQAAGFDAAAPALFLWEGNTMYLPPAKSKDLLRSLFAAFPRAELVMDGVTDAISGAEGATEETQWFYDYTTALMDEVGVSRVWQAVDFHQWAEEVPFKVVEECGMWDLALSLRDEEALTETYGGRAGFEATQGWMKHYRHAHITAP